MRTAALVLADGDPNAACGDAYYAMFYAARAALLAVGEGGAAMGKTHSGLIAAFNLHLVRTGRIAPEHGRDLGAEANRRVVAACEGETLTPEAAEQAIDHAARFVSAVKEWTAARRSA